jgi:hypothetical protein
MENKMTLEQRYKNRIIKQKSLNEFIVQSGGSGSPAPAPAPAGKGPDELKKEVEELVPKITAINVLPKNIKDKFAKSLDNISKMDSLQEQKIKDLTGGTSDLKPSPDDNKFYNRFFKKTDSYVDAFQVDINQLWIDKKHDDIDDFLSEMEKLSNLPDIDSVKKALFKDPNDPNANSTWDFVNKTGPEGTIEKWKDRTTKLIANLKDLKNLNINFMHGQVMALGSAIVNGYNKLAKILTELGADGTDIISDILINNFDKFQQIQIKENKNYFINKGRTLFERKELKKLFLLIETTPTPAPAPAPAGGDTKGKNKEKQKILKQIKGKLGNIIGVAFNSPTKEYADSWEDKALSSELDAIADSFLNSQANKFISDIKEINGALGKLLGTQATAPKPIGGGGGGPDAPGGGGGGGRGGRGGRGGGGDGSGGGAPGGGRGGGRGGGGGNDNTSKIPPDQVSRLLDKLKSMDANVIEQAAQNGDLIIRLSKEFLAAVNKA